MCQVFEKLNIYNMLEYNLPFPDVTRRKMIQPFLLHRGDVVAFKSRDQRTGIIVMEYPNMMMVAVNLYEDLLCCN